MTLNLKEDPPGYCGCFTNQIANKNAVPKLLCSFIPGIKCSRSPSSDNCLAFPHYGGLHLTVLGLYHTVVACILPCSSWSVHLFTGMALVVSCLTPPTVR